MPKSRIKDMAGKKIGRLTVVAQAGNEKGGGAKWLCKCECGNETIVRGADLRKEHTKSCGCIHSEGVAKRNRKHGRTKHPLYRIWSAMKQRCYYKGSVGYSNYGGRGIQICDEWLDDFQAFYDWATANGYQDGLTIERKDYNGNYEPSNCCWATKTEQANNTRLNIRVTVKGETHTVAEWAKITGEKPAKIADRLRRGYEPEQAILKANNNLHLITVGGETHTIKEWGEINNINASTILHRLKRGWSEERAVTTHAHKGGRKNEN